MRLQMRTPDGSVIVESNLYLSFTPITKAVVS